MPRDVRLLQVFVASPSDVKAERETLEKVIKNLNNGVAKSRALVLDAFRWEEDAYAGFHVDGPQGLIDAIIKIEDCDIFIGIFWKRFGTPAKGAKSGTEHEFNIAYEAWQQRGGPHIMFFFREKYETLSNEELEQLQQVRKFREDFPKEGLRWSYNDEKEFSDLVSQQLTNYILNSPQLNYTQLPLEQNVTKAGARTVISEEEMQRRFEDIQAAVNYLKKEFPFMSFKRILEMAQGLLESSQRATKGQAKGQDEARPREIKLN